MDIKKIFTACCLSFFMTALLPVSARSEKLVIVGTGAGMPVLEKVGAAFTRKYPKIKIVLPESIGSGGGIKAVGEDQNILGRVARNISDKEKKYGLIQYPLAELPIVFYVNKSVLIESITPAQACAIYSGSVRRWEDISGGKGFIRVIRREEGDSSLKILLKMLPGFKDIEQTRISKVTYTDQETIHTCIHQKNSIAYGAFPDVKGVAGIRVLRISGISPSDKNYAYFCPLGLVYKEKNLHGSLQKFIEFLSSETAQKAIADAGGLSIK